MARIQRVSKGKTMRPNYFVFCEGETEKAYVSILRAHYRAPIQIIAKKTLLNITPDLVNRVKAAYVCTKNDRTFLMYDLDVTSMLERLRRIPGATLLCSNPCIELWLLLHHADQKKSLTSKECVDRLVSHVPSYRKGTIDAGLKQTLLTTKAMAVERARRSEIYENPSTTVYKLIEALDDFLD